MRSPPKTISSHFWYTANVTLITLAATTIVYMISRKRKSLSRLEDDTNTRFSLPEELRNTAYTQELLVAITLALKAGKNMIPHADSKGTVAGLNAETLLLDIRTKSNKNDFATAIDRINEELIMEEIWTKFPSDHLIGEETTGVCSIPQLTMNKTWILDPIDGTTNFANGLPLSCVSIGLCDKQQPVMGCIYAPMMQELYLAVKGHGAYRNGVQIHSSSASSQNKTLRDSVVVFEFGHRDERDRTAGLDKVLAVVRKLFENGIQASREFGSGVLDLCYVASGRIHIVYAGIHNEGWKPWDYCAGVVVAQEAGAVVKSIFGRPGREGNTDEFDPVTGAVLDDAPGFDIYSKSVICGSTAELVAECRNLIISALETQDSSARMLISSNISHPKLDL